MCSNNYQSYCGFPRLNLPVRSSVMLFNHYAAAAILFAAAMTVKLGSKREDILNGLMHGCAVHRVTLLLCEGRSVYLLIVSMDLQKITNYLNLT